MELTPREKDKLLLFYRRAGGGTPPGPRPEAQLSGVRGPHQRLYYGRRPRRQSVASLMEEGRHVLTREQVMEGVPEMIPDIQVEATFPDGSKLVTVHNPII